MADELVVGRGGRGAWEGEETWGARMSQKKGGGQLWIRGYSDLGFSREPAALLKGSSHLECPPTPDDDGQKRLDAEREVGPEHGGWRR